MIANDSKSMESMDTVLDSVLHQISGQGCDDFGNIMNADLAVFVVTKNDLKANVKQQLQGKRALR